MTEPSPTRRSRGPRRSLGSRRRSDRRVLAVGLVLSALAHLVVIGLVSDWLGREPAEPRPRTPALMLEPPTGMRAVEVTSAPGAAPTQRPEEPDPEEDEDEEAPPVVVEAPVARAPADTVAADDRTAADRLATRVVDPRLWRPVILIPREPTIEDVEARIAAAVELLSDSALAEAEAAVRARDWTVEDAEGGRWGVSPGKLHLGSLTLPLPIWFPVDPEAIAAEQQWLELDHQLERTRILESFEERVRAIRERRERERAEARGAANGGG